MSSSQQGGLGIPASHRTPSNPCWFGKWSTKSSKFPDLKPQRRASGAQTGQSHWRKVGKSLFQRFGFLCLLPGCDRGTFPVGIVPFWGSEVLPPLKSKKIHLFTLKKQVHFPQNTLTVPSSQNRCKSLEIFGISAPNSGGKVPDSFPKRKGRNNPQQGSKGPQSCQVCPCRATRGPSAASSRWLQVPLCPRAPSGCPSCQGEQRGRGVGAAVQVVEGLQRALGAVADVGELHRGPGRAKEQHSRSVFTTQFLFSQKKPKFLRVLVKKWELQHLEGVVCSIPCFTPLGWIKT